MARIRGGHNNKEKIVSINRWFGVNENPDGDIHLKLGEASAMTNFKITSGGSLQKRPGTQNVANLLFDYDVAVAAEPITVLTETLGSNAMFTVFPDYNVTDGGLLYLYGTPATVNYANIAAHAGKYWQDAYGVIWQIGTCDYSAGSGNTAYRWDKWSVDTTTYPYYYTEGPFVQWGSWSALNSGDVWTAGTGYQFNQWSGQYSVVGSKMMGWGYGSQTGYAGGGSSVVQQVVSGGGLTSYISSAQGPTGGGTSYAKGSVSHGYVYGADGAYPVSDKVYDSSAGTYFWYDNKTQNVTYTWNFYRVSLVPNTADSNMRTIWAGRVADNEVICAACNGRLWQLSVDGEGLWTKASVGFIDTDGAVHFFGFDGKLYILDGAHYKVWDGAVLTEAEGYRPVVATQVPPAGGGMLRQRVNMLNGLRRIRCSPTGSTATFKLPEGSLAAIDKVILLATGAEMTIASRDLAAGTVTLSQPPAAGTDTIEIHYTAASAQRGIVEAMTRSELYNGATDNRIFLYGDGSNMAIYSDLDYNGQARADYFPDLNFVHVGASNTPVTSMVRHYDRLLAFKEDSAYSIAYNALTLADGSVTAGFYVTTINKGIGAAGLGQAVLVDNHPRTLDGRSIYEWVATTTNGNITSDQRNAQRVSQNVWSTLRAIDETKAIALYDKIHHEYYVVENGIAIVQNTENGAWYIYRDFPAVCMIVYRDELYYGTAEGFLRHVSRAYRHDCGAPIQCYWESGSMDFGLSCRKKSSDTLWIVLQPEDDAAVTVTVQTDNQSGFQGDTILEDNPAADISAFFDNLNLNPAHISFNVNNKPHTQRRRLRVKNFTWYKLIFSSVSSDTTVTLLNADIKVRPTSMVR